MLILVLIANSFASHDSFIHSHHYHDHSYGHFHSYDRSYGYYRYRWSRPRYYYNDYRGYNRWGRPRGGLLGRIFRGLFGGGGGGYYDGYPNYYYNGYGYSNYGNAQCTAQFIDYVGNRPRYYCNCPPYPPNYQYFQCVPMAGKK
ncbi:unnamed protein product [Caenorhabditis bovis]|uniref:Uncharacterized protein n=1 Tax=Caenorhabditis bovis TaxID=2654633 RepID=A0A8S1F5A4_9PELO|nr:unnamed protein product [Caenorhabditis bovis]